MYRLYDEVFKTGFVVNLSIFALANIVDYLEAQNQYDLRIREPNAFSPAPGFPAWGVPFSWSGYNFGFVADGLVLNFIAIAACGFLIGLIFRYVKMTSSSSQHNQ
jgi:hypothetical protein